MVACLRSTQSYKPNRSREQRVEPVKIGRTQLKPVKTSSYQYICELNDWYKYLRDPNMQYGCTLRRLHFAWCAAVVYVALC